MSSNINNNFNPFSLDINFIVKPAGFGYWSPATIGRLDRRSAASYPDMERCLMTVLLSSNSTSCRLCSSVRFLVSSRICVLRRNSLLA